MDRHHRESGRSEPEPGHADRVSDETALRILKTYSAGDISAREAAKALGPAATEHDVFAGILGAGLPLPVPSPEEIEREVEGLRRLHGPDCPRRQN